MTSQSAFAANTATYTATETIPVPPSSSYSGSGGGDGWALAFTNTAVYNVFHHSGSLTVACHLQSDASPCWTPETITDASGDGFATSGQPGLWLNQATGKLYVYATRTSDSTGGVVCIDTTQAATNSDPFCGFTILTAVGEAPQTRGISAISNMAVVGSKLYAFNYAQGAGVSGTENKLLCFDTSTQAACTGQPYTVAIGSGVDTDGSYPPPEVTVIAGQIIIPATTGSSELACYDPSTSSNCAGSWPIQLSSAYASNYGAAFPLMTSAGTVTGLCLPDGTDDCFSLTGAAVSTPASMPAAIPASDGWNGPAFVLGPRVYVANGNTNEVHCYDYSTNASCTNFPKSFSNLGYLYTVNPDPQRPTCIWVNSDNGGGQIQNFDAYTGAGCGQGAIRVLASSLVSPAPACIPASYSSLQVTSPSRTSYASGSVAFEDFDGNPLPGVPNQTLDNTGAANLTGLSLNVNGLPQFLITLAGATGAPSSVVVKLTWVGTGAYNPSCIQGGGSNGGSYVALGDSYSSGDGVPPYIQPDDGCHRSALSWPFKVNLDLGFYKPRFKFHACSGALIQYLTQRNPTKNEPPQQKWLGSETQLVTLTWGGDNADFARVITTCVFDASCQYVWQFFVNSAISKMRASSGPISLLQLYETIAQKAPNATVVVMGYPRFFPKDPPFQCGTGAGRYFYHSQMLWINSEIQSMDNTISGAVMAANRNGYAHVRYVTGSYNAFSGHELCTSDPYYNAVVPSFVGKSFHPGLSGNQRMAQLVEGTYAGG